jgi:hypothetical protein
MSNGTPINMMDHILVEGWQSPICQHAFPWPGPTAEEPDMTVGRLRWRRAVSPIIEIIAAQQSKNRTQNAIKEYATIVCMGQALLLKHTDKENEMGIPKGWDPIQKNTGRKTEMFAETKAHPDDRKAFFIWMGKTIAGAALTKARDQDVLLEAMAAQFMLYWVAQAWLKRSIPSPLKDAVDEVREELADQGLDQNQRSWKDLSAGCEAFLIAWQKSRKALGRKRPRQPSSKKRDVRVKDMAEQLMILRGFVATYPDLMGEEAKDALRELGRLLEVCHTKPDIRRFVQSLEDQEVLRGVVAAAAESTPEPETNDQPAKPRARRL